MDSNDTFIWSTHSNWKLVSVLTRQGCEILSSLEKVTIPFGSLLIILQTLLFLDKYWLLDRSCFPVYQQRTGMKLTAEGDLVLRDVDGTLAWSTNTAGKFVVGLNLTDEGLKEVCCSASVSSTNWTEGGLFSFSVTSDGVVAFVESNPTQTYFSRLIGGSNESRVSNYVIYLNGSLALLSNSSDSDSETVVSIPPAASAQYMKLESDGHLRVYEWLSRWKEVDDVLTGYYDPCYYPMVCGRYGICSSGQCSCPKSSSSSTIYFSQLNYRKANLGCSEITRLTCNDLNNHRFLELQDVDYFAFTADVKNTGLPVKMLV